MLNMAKVSKNDLSVWQSKDVMKGGIPCVGISPRRAHMPFTGSAAQDLLKKNVFKRVCFWMWWNDKLVQLPKEPSVTWTVDAVCFSRAATVSQEFICYRYFGDECFRNKAQFGAGFAHGLILKYGVDKRSWPWFGTGDGKWNCIKFLRFVGNWHARSRESLAPLVS